MKKLLSFLLAVAISAQVTATVFGDIKAGWYAPSDAVWNLSDESNYTVNLYDYKDNLVSSAAISIEKDNQSSDMVYSNGQVMGRLNYAETLADSGENVYYFTVSHADDNSIFYQSDLLYYDSIDDGVCDNLTAHSTALNSLIGFVGNHKFCSFLYNWNYTVDKPDLISLENEALIPNFYPELLYNITYEGMGSQQQFIFNPVQAGIVTITYTYDAKGTPTPETMYTISYTYKIDENLNVQLIDPENMLISGDADNNGVLNAADSAFVLQKALVSTFSLPIEELPYENLILKDGIAVSGHKEIIDVNKNGIIDAADAAQILQTVLDPEYTTS